MRTPTASAGPDTRPRAASGGRDPLVDALRATALVRVVLWHAFAAAWLSWVFPAMPVMFFLAGSLLTVSVRGASVGAPGGVLGAWWGVARRRALRLLVPLWLYGLVVGGAGAAVALERGGSPAEVVSLPGVPRWLLPLAVPSAPAVQQGWLSSHLWYVTDYLWLVALAPLFLVAARRVETVVVLTLAALAVLEVGSLRGWPTPHGELRVVVGDLACYGLFAALGAAWGQRRAAPAHGTRGVPPHLLVALGVLLAASAVVLTRWLPPARGSLNSGYLLLTLSGLGWLVLVAGLQGPLRRLASRPAVRTVTSGFTARAVTVYLWHPAAIVLARTVVTGRDAVAVVSVLVLTGAGTAAAVLAFGWVEDLAARRPARLWPGLAPLTLRGTVRLAPGTTVAAVATTLALAVALSGGPSGSLLSIPTPSDRSALSDEAFRLAGAPRPAYRPAPTSLPAPALQQALDDWLARTPEIDAATVAVASTSALWTGSTAVQGDETLSPDARLPVASLTKSMTAALVLQEAAAGHLALDAPVPPVAGLDVAGTPLPTPRQLLRHTSGLPQYTDAPGYDDQHVGYRPAELVELSVRGPRPDPPGAHVLYSNSNYLWLGMVLEQITGSSYARLVQDRIAGPLGLVSTAVEDPDLPGWIGSSSGGVVSTPRDLAVWFDALLNGDRVLDRHWRDEAIDLQRDNVGLGLWPVCPCGEDDAGVKWAVAYGQALGMGGGFALPSEGISVAARLSPEGARAMDLTPSLLEALREALGEAPGEALPTRAPVLASGG